MVATTAAASLAVSSCRLAYLDELVVGGSGDVDAVIHSVVLDELVGRPVVAWASLRVLVSRQTQK